MPHIAFAWATTEFPNLPRPSAPRVTTAVITAVALFLSGCVTTSNRIDSAERSAETSASAGILLATFDRPEEIQIGDWQMGIREYDPAATGSAAPIARDGSVANHATFIWQGEKWLQKGDHPLAFEMKPGRYAITHFTPYLANQPLPHTYPAGGGGIGAGAGLAIIGIALLVGAAAAVSEQERREALVANRPPMLFMVDGAFVEETPTFEVKAGEVVYLGHFKLGGTAYTAESRVPHTGDPGSSGDDRLERRDFTLFFVEYGPDPAQGRSAASSLGLTNRPMRSVSLDLPAGRMPINPNLTPEYYAASKKDFRIVSQRDIALP